MLSHGLDINAHLWHDVELVIDDLVFHFFFVLTLSVSLKGQRNPGVVCSGRFDSIEDFIWDLIGDFAVAA